MAFNIQEFASSLTRQGVAHQSHFDMLIVPPARLNLPGEDVTVRVVSSELPGRDAQTLVSRYWGPERRIAYNPGHPPITIAVLVSADLRERDFFNAWNDLALGAYRQRLNDTAGAFNIGYYDDYVGTATVRQYNRDGEVVTATVMEEVHPVLVSSLPLDWANEDTHRLNVTLAYRLIREDPQRDSNALNLVRRFGGN